VTVLGVDIGGTKIASGRVDGSRVAGFHVIPTLAAEGLEVSLAQVWRAIDASLTPDVEAIGLCSPGPC
jgi:predicted NBD/HSP70 family sugar kinase